MNKTLLASLVILVVAACAPAPQPVSSEVLMEADRAFDAAVAAGGTDAWVSWFAEDGAMIQPGLGEVRGHAAVRQTMGALDDANVSLRWQPERADIAASGDLGWTTGSYVSEVSTPDGTTQRATGRYVSIWRLQADGTWKVVMDLGNPSELPE